MEIAKFILSAIGTFLTVFGLSFTIFQYWRKKQDEKFDLLKCTLEKMVYKESNSHSNAINRLDKRIERLEQNIVQGFEKRLSTMEGELHGIKLILKSIQDWFITNTPKGGK